MRPLRARCTECFAPSWQKKPTEFLSSCGLAAPSWILTRTPGDQPNSLKLWAIITDSQSEYCDSKWPPVGILLDGRCRDQIIHSCSDKFGDHWYKTWHWFQQYIISSSCFFSLDQVSDTHWFLLTQHLELLLCHWSLLVSPFLFGALQTHYRIIMLRLKTPVQHIKPSRPLW